MIKIAKKRPKLLSMSHVMESEKERDWKKSNESAEMAIIARNAVHIIDFCFVRDIFAVGFFFSFYPQHFDTLSEWWWLILRDVVGNCVKERERVNIKNTYKSVTISSEKRAHRLLLSSQWWDWRVFGLVSNANVALYYQKNIHI